MAFLLSSYHNNLKTFDYAEDLELKMSKSGRQLALLLWKNFILQVR